MKNRPDKPGPWLFQAKDEDIPWCVQILKTGQLVFPGFSVRFKCASEFERSNMFIRWLGPAHQPKKVQRYNLEREYVSGGPTSNQYMSKSNRYSPGQWVRYDDVKEFLIGEDDERE